jgi:hypothetical protein
MWIYSQSTGKFWNEAAICIADDCYSGSGPGKNQPTLQQIPDIGPLPEGLYWIEDPHDSDETGPDTCRLIPADGTDTFNRGQFAMHGDSISHPGEASKGCIIMRYDVRRVVIAAIQGKPAKDPSRKLWVNP